MVFSQEIVSCVRVAPFWFTSFVLNQDHPGAMRPPSPGGSRHQEAHMPQEPSSSQEAPMPQEPTRHQEAPRHQKAPRHQEAPGTRSPPRWTRILFNKYTIPCNYLIPIKPGLLTLMNGPDIESDVHIIQNLAAQDYNLCLGLLQL